MDKHICNVGIFEQFLNEFMWVLGVLNSLFGQSGSGSLNEGEDLVLLNNGKLVVVNLLDLILWSVAGVVRVHLCVCVVCSKSVCFLKDL